MNDLTKYISVSARRTKMFYTEHLKKIGVSSGQFMYIVAICECLGQTQEELAHKLLIDKSTVAKVLAQLEEEGYITKAINPSDRRAFNIFPTDRAKAIYLDIIKIKEDWHNKLTEDLSELEREIFEKLMKKVMENAVKNYK